jgi:hypothetical protein
LIALYQLIVTHLEIAKFLEELLHDNTPLSELSHVIKKKKKKKISLGSVKQHGQVTTFCNSELQ